MNETEINLKNLPFRTGLVPVLPVVLELKYSQSVLSSTYLEKIDQLIIQFARFSSILILSKISDQHNKTFYATN
jgi:hypothetical protein